ncbi:tail protein [Amycolatopsis sp. NBRC 101858]|uniref:phage tail sheath subtilisin-like domain-containing protein n=1 Tax=Amycolatopsis sp. NBRC 101858 TaxID=3032200 RepID=UPI0024A3DA1B|nr:phage tail sheath subtilisin-like domain-containing protein [Amycolatopsis sp. NBRC 101858]GLY40024.1 tail protein [Amycolatopsis sp. NBRC 101858]
MTSTALPGVSLTFERAATGDEPLRTDVAVFLGRTRRGPVGRPVRVESWNDVVGAFGPPDGTSATPYALRGFFENQGRTAWVLRVAGPAEPASALWTDGFRVVAASPGAWANGGRVSVRYRASSVAGPPVVTVRVLVPGEPAEIFAGMAPGEVVGRIAASRLIRVVPAGAGSPIPADGPISRSWDLTLTGGTDSPPERADYASAVVTQAELPEPALVALPDLGADLGGAEHTSLVLDLLAAVAPLLDRLVLLDVPPSVSTVDAVVAWAGELAGFGDEALLAAAAVYHPPLRAPSPDGTGLRTVPASGHVAGLIARLDAERGPAGTPANATLLDAVDLAVEYPEAQQVRLFEGGVDLVRCLRGRGLVVWGGRTLSGDPRRVYIAHRRLLHLLVRAIRRAAAPLVFDVNSPELRLSLVRAITSVLLEAFRTGALAGSRPEDAFRVVCDETNNPPDQDPGQVVCEIGVAPAVPMEFIALRLVLGQDRGLEVIEQ